MTSRPCTSGYMVVFFSYISKKWYINQGDIMEKVLQFTLVRKILSGTNTCTPYNKGAPREILFANDYYLYKCVVLLNHEFMTTYYLTYNFLDLNSWVNLQDLYAIYSAKQTHAPDGYCEDVCVLRPLNILSESRIYDNAIVPLDGCGLLYNHRTWDAQDFPLHNLHEYPGQYIDATDMLDLGVQGGNMLPEPLIRVNRFVPMRLPYANIPHSSFSFTPISVNVPDRVVLGSIMAAILPYQVDRLHSVFDVDSMSACTHTQHTMYNYDTDHIELVLDGQFDAICIQYGIRLLTVIKSGDEMVSIEIVYHDHTRWCAIIDPILFVLSSKCIIERPLRMQLSPYYYEL